MRKHRWLTGVILALLVLIPAQIAMAAWPGQFADVDTWPEWALKGKPGMAGLYLAWGGDLAEAVWWELMIGDPPAGGNPETRRTFRPQDTITRAEYATILARTLGLDATPGGGAKWYAPVVQALRERGIITAGGGFGAAITRREMGEWVGRALEWYGVDLSDRPELQFSDIAGLPEAPYILLASRAGVIKGYPDGSYGPQRTATRAEAAAMAVRVAKQLRKNPPAVEVFENLVNGMWDAIRDAEMRRAKGGEYSSASLESFITPLSLYGPGGFHAGATFYYSVRYDDDSYRELLNAKVEPIMLRDAIAIVKTTLQARRIRLNGSVVHTDEITFYDYYVKRGGLWLETNTKKVEEFPEGWLPQQEGGP